MTHPLVTVICLCYNQARFIEEAVQSVFQQTYPNIELIVIDDASTDSSQSVIKKIATTYPEIKTLLLNKNMGNCRAFNKGLQMAKGDYLIDLAADDVLLPQRIEKGVSVLFKAGPDFGVNFCDAELIDENGRHLSVHSDRFPHDSVPRGDIYKDLITRYFICPPTVMFTREVIERLEGYDETLTYEDFDFWIRSSRKFKYCYSPEVLVKRRILRHSQSRDQFRFFTSHSKTTFEVCRKIMSLNKSRAEQEALSHRLLYEMKLNARLFGFPMVLKYLQLWIRNQKLYYE